MIGMPWYGCHDRGAMIGVYGRGSRMGLGRGHLVVRYFSKIRNIEKTTC